MIYQRQPQTIESHPQFTHKFVGAGLWNNLRIILKTVIKPAQPHQ